MSRERQNFWRKGNLRPRATPAFNLGGRGGVFDAPVLRISIEKPGHHKASAPATQHLILKLLNQGHGDTGLEDVLEAGLQQVDAGVVIPSYYLIARRR
jgi:hypothetical protein